jgi:D-sedoheptulose 7-phosphate isomerase
MRPLKGEFTPSLQAGPPPEILSFASRRSGAARSLVGQVPEIARAGRAMAQRFHRRGKLIAFGSGAAATDAQNVTVEFLQPAVAGKRALPAVCLLADVATLTGAAEAEGWVEAFANPLRQIARTSDIALALSARRESENVRRALQVARERGLLTVSLVGEVEGPSAPVDHRIVVGAGDPLVAREIQVTAYHVLWELVHAFLDQPQMLTRAES